MTLGRVVRRNLPLLGIISCLVVFAFKDGSRGVRGGNEGDVADDKGGEEEEDAQDVVIVGIDRAKADNLGCDEKTAITSSRLDSRYPWPDDQQCANYKVSHMIPHCRAPIALASYPGSGNTWVRYLLEGAGGVFTGSRYKDLQIQTLGLWGEIRDWREGSTIVQKTHDADGKHVMEDFGGRAVLIVRNPYAAILSDHNFIYAGHHGSAPLDNFERRDWPRFVAIQAGRWFSMLDHWTKHSSTSKVLVIHYESVQSDIAGSLRTLLRFLGLPLDEARVACVERHHRGFFKRRRRDEPEVVAFKKPLRSQMDELIEKSNSLLAERGFEPMPLDLYDFYRKSDAEIRRGIKGRNSRRKGDKRQDEKEEPEVKPQPANDHRGTKMVLRQYFNWLDSGNDPESKSAGEDLKTTMMRHLFRKFRENSPVHNTVTGLSERAEGLLTKAVEIWPVISKPFQSDPVEDVIKTEGDEGIREVRDVLRHFQANGEQL